MKSGKVWSKMKRRAYGFVATAQEVMARETGSEVGVSTVVTAERDPEALVGDA